ncbi:hypothetical protein CNECB9_4260012 [Cupriavidus necator]|uniref:Uncharacterized protein n=1 Tax=Cupriavidus necator TaxID=106590 RepID=A0A1K0ILJ2_CUPNE|nr:hypothetical protein CNECB9_4260012 [Cupriavidus necator]
MQHSWEAKPTKCARVCCMQGQFLVTTATSSARPFVYSPKGLSTNQSTKSLTFDDVCHVIDSAD